MNTKLVHVKRMTAALIAVSLLACAKGGDSGSSGNSAPPAAPTPPVKPTASAQTSNAGQAEVKVDRSEAQSAKALTLEEKAKVRSIMTAPSASLFVPMYNLFSSSSTQTESDKLDLIKGNGCKINPLTKTSTGNTATVGSTAVETETYSVVDEADQPGQCPVAISQRRMTTTNLTASDTKENTVTGKRHADYTRSVVLKNHADFTEIPFAIMGVAVTQDLKFDGWKEDANHQITAGDNNLSVQGKLDAALANGQAIHFQFSAQDLKSVGHRDRKEVLKMAFPGVATTLVLGLFQTDDGAPEILLNGEKYTTARLKSELGINLTVPVKNNK